MADRNGYFQLIVKDDGTYIHIIPREGSGEPLSIEDVMYYLAVKDIDFNMVELNSAIARGSELTYKLNGNKPMPEREMSKILIKDEGMTAILRVYAPTEGGGLMDKKEIMGDLNYNKVVHGIDEAAIDAFLADRQYCKDYVVAKGTPVVESTDARIEYLFKTDLSQRPAQNEDGSVDFFNLDNICQCTKDQVLARMIPIDPGVPGKTVRGESIAPRNPRRVLFQYGRNIIKSEDGLSIKSAVNGHVTLVDEKVFVSSVLELQNVDTTTGNIDFDGSVQVEGNVISGFSIKATGDVEVKGVVEGATIVAGGQIIIRRGINGMAKGDLTAGSNVLSKFIENATVHSGGYVETDCIIHSTVSASSHIVVQGKKGFITGGAVRAGSYIEAKTLGSDMGVDTLLEVGVDPTLKERYAALQKEIVSVKKEIARLEPVVKAIGEKLGRGEKMPIEQMKQAKALSTALAQNKELLNNDTQEMAKLEIQFDQSTDASVRVTGQAYPGTKISVSDVSLRLKTPYHYCKFVRDGADVAMRPL